MALRLITLLVALLAVTVRPAAQDKDPVLFTVEGKPVLASEFMYIYEKTNGKNADYSRKSLEEYLDLYVRFKLKVQRAKELKLDTIPTLQRELEGYRRQLADSYLIDKEVTEKLTAEAYERVKFDIDISHVLIAVPAAADPADTLAAYQKAMEARKRLNQGEDFAKVARELSQDKSAASNGGHIGHVTALLPNGFYPLETAAYTLAPNKISNPIRTSAGYHIVKVHGKRPARGEVEAAHIMLRTKDKDPLEVKMRIDSIYKALQNGADFDELATSLSQDGFTAEKKGYIGFFGINRYEPAFEDAAFALAKDGDISQPVQSSVGWHVIRRISRREIQPYAAEKRRLEERVKRDARHEAARTAMIERIKRDAGFVESPKVLQAFIDTLPGDFFSFRWKAPEPKSEVELFRLGKAYRASLGDFTDYLGRATRQRNQLGQTGNPAEAVRDLYQDFVNESVVKYQESILEQKYPDFRYLMREYEEGIMLFEATQLEVWNKASQDSSGLEAFFKRVQERYRWDERARVSNYRLSASAKDKIGEILSFIEKNHSEAVLSRFNTEDNIILSVEENLVEKTKNNLLIGTPWRVGAVSPTRENERNNTLMFFKIEEIIPSTTKSLDEARGYVIAEYQDYLEQEWVDQLRKMYKVSINQKNLDTLVKK